MCGGTSPMAERTQQVELTSHHCQLYLLRGPLSTRLVSERAHNRGDAWGDSPFCFRSQPRDGDGAFPPTDGRNGPERTVSVFERSRPLGCGAPLRVLSARCLPRVPKHAADGAGGETPGGLRCRAAGLSVRPDGRLRTQRRTTPQWGSRAPMRLIERSIPALPFFDSACPLC